MVMFEVGGHIDNCESIVWWCLWKWKDEDLNAEIEEEIEYLRQ